MEIIEWCVWVVANLSPIGQASVYQLPQHPLSEIEKHTSHPSFNKRSHNSSDQLPRTPLPAPPSCILTEHPYSSMVSPPALTQSRWSGCRFDKAAVSQKLYGDMVTASPKRSCLRFFPPTHFVAELVEHSRLHVTNCIIGGSLQCSSNHA